MKKFYTLVLLFISITTFCQTVEYPKVASTNMENHSIDKIVTTSYETTIYFTYKSHAQTWDADCGDYTCFNISKNATIRTNTGQELKLSRCVNLTLKGNDTYWAHCHAGDNTWQAVFSKIDADATTIDFQENAGADSYYMSGIDLKGSNGTNSLARSIEKLMDGDDKPEEKAWLNLTNNTDAEVVFAYAYLDRSSNAWTTVGWYKIEAYKEFNLDLGGYSGHVYIHGEQSAMLGLSKTSWGQGHQLCVDPDNSFKIKNADKISCDNRVGFSDKVITGGVNKWTFNP